jgi:RNA polymerase sigma-70 factor (ECF subfamily)
MIEPDGDARSQVTRLLIDWNAGDPLALEQLTPLVYAELRKLARVHLSRERNAQTIRPTELVHEAYLRLVAQDHVNFESRHHFFGVAAHLMRRILADHFRKKNSQKRGGGAPVLLLDEALAVGEGKDRAIVALDDAMTALTQFDERKCKVIELRFFGGFSVEETAQALDISVATVGREQRLAEAWLAKEVLRASQA